MEKLMNKDIKILSGTFEKGCGLIVHHIPSDNIYHLLVFEDKETHMPFIEIKGKQYFENDVVGRDGVKNEHD